METPIYSMDRTLEQRRIHVIADVTCIFISTLNGISTDICGADISRGFRTKVAHGS